MLLCLFFFFVLAYVLGSFVYFTLCSCSSSFYDCLLVLFLFCGKSSVDPLTYTSAYVSAAFPALPAWVRARAHASSAGKVNAGCENQTEFTKMHLYHQTDISELRNVTKKHSAGIKSETSRQKTKDQVYDQNEMID